MKIIAISHRKMGLSALVLDDGQEILVDTELLLSKGISEKSEIDDIEKLLYESDFKRAKSRGFWYLSRRDYSKKELTDKLVSGGFSHSAAVAAVEKICEMGYVDDQAYAERLFEQLSERGLSSKREVIEKLRLKGVPSEIIKQISENFPSDEEEKIKELIGKRYAGRLATEDGTRKVFAALIRKGFQFSDVKRAIREYNLEFDCEED